MGPLAQDYVNLYLHLRLEGVLRDVITFGAAASLGRLVGDKQIM